MQPPAAVLDYDPAWRDAFQRIRQHLAPALQGIAERIEHVGSTAVPGLAAKPIIDVDVVVASADRVQDVITALPDLGYEHRGNLGIEGREAFSTPEGLPYHHLYVVVNGNEAYRDHIDVRDFLLSHPDAAAEYAQRKRELEPLLTTDRDLYVERKGEFVEELLRRARAINPDA